MAALSCNEFKNAIEAEFGKCKSWLGEKNGQVYKSAGWIDRTYKIEVTPLTPVVTKPSRNGRG